MTKKLFAMLMAVGLMLTMVAGASAEHGSSGPESLFPAQNEGACEAHGGVFTQVGSLRTCTVDDVDYETVRAAGSSGNGWIVEYEVSAVYTRDGSTLNTSGPFTTIVACYNPGSKEMDPTHKNCQLPE